MTARRTALVALTLAVTLVACATLPPPVPVDDVGKVRGVWRGEIHSTLGVTPVRVLIREDGTYQWWASEKTGGGVLSLREGKLWGTFSSGLAWVATLREAEGRRSLSLAVPDAGAAGSLTPEE